MSVQNPPLLFQRTALEQLQITKRKARRSPFPRVVCATKGWTNGWKMERHQKNLQNWLEEPWIEDSPFGTTKKKPRADPPETQLLALFRRLKDFEDFYQQQGCLWQMARPKNLEPTEWIWPTNPKYVAPSFAAKLLLEILHQLVIQGRVWEKVLTPKWWDGHSRNSNLLNSSIGRERLSLSWSMDKIQTHLFGWKYKKNAINGTFTTSTSWLDELSINPCLSLLIWLELRRAGLQCHCQTKCLLLAFVLCSRTYTHHLSVEIF